VPAEASEIATELANDPGLMAAYTGKRIRLAAALVYALAHSRDRTSTKSRPVGAGNA
jgi:hypothetical protein